jgi:predicted dehydrogenase
MKKKYKYACVGAGGIARSKHIPGYSEIEKVNVLAVSDPNTDAARKTAEKFDIPEVYSDYTEMFEKVKPDLISICTPNCLHAPVAIEAMKRGIHVHCEKPLAMNAEEAQKMAEASKVYGRKLMVGLNNRFTNEAQFVKRYADEGMFGEIYHARCGWRRRRGIPGKGGWFTTRSMSGGGPLIDLGVHLIDLAMYFMGNPSPRSVTGSVYSRFGGANSENAPEKNGKYDVEDMAVGFVKLANGASVDIEFSWASNIEKENNYYELMGTKGGVCYSEGELKIFSEILNTTIDIKPNIDKRKKVIDEFTHFIDCIENDMEPMPSAWQAVDIMKIIGGIYCSAETGREVMF